MFIKFVIIYNQKYFVYICSKRKNFLLDKEINKYEINLMLKYNFFRKFFVHAAPSLHTRTSRTIKHLLRFLKYMQTSTFQKQPFYVEISIKFFKLPFIITSITFLKYFLIIEI